MLETDAKYLDALLGSRPQSKSSAAPIQDSLGFLNRALTISQCTSTSLR